MVGGSSPIIPTSEGWATNQRRIRLHGALNRALSRGHILVTAGPGFGKTELVRTWAAAAPDSAAITFISLDQSLAEPAALLEALTASDPRGPQLASASREAALIQIGRLSAQTVIVCDQVEAIRDTPAQALLEAILGMTDGPRMVLACRTPFPTSAAQLADGRICEIHADELRFTPDELGELFADVGDDVDLRHLQTATDGWPLGVMLYRQAVYQAADLNDVPARFRSHVSRLDQYFDANIGCELADWRQLAARAALLERVTADGLDFALANAIGRTVVNSLAFQGILTPEDPVARTWRFAHPLLRNYLASLAPISLSERSELQDRAAEWASANGDPISAVRYAAAAQNWTRVGQIIFDAGGWRLAVRWRNESPTWSDLNGIFDRLPADIIAASPTLQLTQLYLLSTTGELSGTMAAYDVLSEQLRAFGDPALESELTIVGHFLRLLEDRVLDETEFALLEAASMQVAHGDAMAAAMLENAMGYANLELGNLDASISCGARATRIYESLGQGAASVALIDYNQGNALMLGARYDDARTAFERGISRAVKLYGPRSDVARYGQAMLAELAVDEGRYQVAERLISNAVPSVESLGRGGTPIAFQTRIRVAARREGLSSAYRHVFDSAKTAKRKQLPRVERLVMICWAEQMCCFGHFQAAAKLLDRLRPDSPLDVRDVHPTVANEHVEAWVELSTGQAEQALARLNWLRDSVGPHLGARARVDWYVLRSLANWELQRDEDTMADMIEALRLAAPSSIIRPFVDRRDGVTTILRALRQRRQSRPLDHAADRFLLTILSGTHKAAQDLVSAAPELVVGAREREIIELLGRKLSNKEIGRLLDISENTVKWHLKNLFEKFKTRDRHALYQAWRSLSNRIALPETEVDAIFPAR